jgi:protein TonB
MGAAVAIPQRRISLTERPLRSNDVATLEEPAKREATESSADEPTAQGARLLQLMTESVREQTGATGAAIALDNNGQTVCVASAGTAPPVGVTIDRDTGISGACLSTGRTILCEDAETDARVNRAGASYIRSIIAAPVLAGDRAGGLVEVLSTSAHAFEASHVGLVEDLARFLERHREVAGNRTVSIEPAAAVEAPAFAEPVAQPVSLGEESRASVAVGETDLAARARSAMLMVAANSRTIGLTAAALVLFIAVLWLALRPRSVKSETPQPEVAAAVVPSQPPATVAEQATESPAVAVPARRHASTPQTSKLEENNTAERDPAPVVLQPTRAGSRKAASEAQVDPPPALAIASAPLASLPLGNPAAVSLSLGQRSGGEPVYKVQPKYPQIALSQNLGGDVQLVATVDTKGRVKNVSVRSGDSLLAAAAVSAVRQWRYKPLMIDGRAVEHETPVTVNFKPRRD